MVYLGKLTEIVECFVEGSTENKMNETNAFLRPDTITCIYKKSDGTACRKRISLDLFRWYPNNRRNAKYKLVVKVRCGTHWIYICPICYCVQHDHAKVIQCFSTHSDTVRCGVNCTTIELCRDYNNFIQNHKQSISVASNHIPIFQTPSKRRRDIDNEFQKPNSLPESRRQIGELQRFEHSCENRDDMLISEGRSFATLAEENVDEEETPIERLFTVSPGCNDLQRRSARVVTNSVVKCITHSYKCDTNCQCDHLPKPLEQQIENSSYPFPSQSYLDFVIEHKMKSNISDINMDKLLKDLHTKYQQSGHLNIPHSVAEIKRYLSRMPRMKSHTLPNYPKSPLFKIADVLSNVLNDDFLFSRMCFSSKTEPDVVEELYESVEWNTIVKDTRKRTPNALPIGILLFYDDFRKYGMIAGSCGGLYMAIVNMDRDLLSKPDNIFCLGLIDSEEFYWPNYGEQLEELYQPHYAKTERNSSSSNTTRYSFGRHFSKK